MTGSAGKGSTSTSGCRSPSPRPRSGTTLNYETLDGAEELTIAAGTQSGAVLRLRGKGVPQLQGRGRGDLLVELAVVTPTDLSQEEEELLRRFAELRGEDVAEADTGFLARIKHAFR